MRKIVPIIVNNEFACNCYLLFQEQHAIVIDPGTKNHRIIDEIESRQAQVDAIVLTNGHFDHIAGVDKLVKQYHCPVYIHEADEPMLYDSYLNFSVAAQPFILKTKAVPLGVGTVNIGVFQLTVIDAPGHSEGSVLIQWGNDLFSGDTLFQMGIGRTDLASGSNSKMMQTLRMVKQLDPSLHIYPGHGEFTTMQEELNFNPYLIQV